MAIAFTESQTYESGSGGFQSSHTLPDLDASGTDSIAIAAGFNRDPTSDVTSWTFEGNTPTQIASAINTNVVAVDLYRYVINNAATTIVSNTPTFKLQAMIGASFTGVHQTTPTTGTPSTSTGFGSSATLSYTGTSGNYLIVAVSTQDDRTFTASSCTQAAQVTHGDTNLGSGFIGYVAATGSSQTIGATWTTDTNYAIVLAELAIAGGGGAPRRVFIV